MKTSANKAVLFAAAFLALGAAALPAMAANEDQSPVANQTAALPARDGVAPSGALDRGSGIYDRYDHYRNAQGFPAQGWAQLRGAS